MKSVPPLSRREREVLTLLARFRFLTRRQIQAFLFESKNNTKPLSAEVMTLRLTKRLLDKGLISRTNRGVGGPAGGSTSFVYFLTHDGGDAVPISLGRRAIPRGTFLLRHSLAAGEVVLAFMRSAAASAGHALVEVATDWECAERLGHGVIVPDLFLTYATLREEILAFVEVDLGTAGSRFFRRKIDRYLALHRSATWEKTLGIWPVVLTVTPTDARARLLRGVTERALAADPGTARVTEFAFTSLPRLAEHGPLAAVWEIAGGSGRVGLLAKAAS